MMTGMGNKVKMTRKEWLGLGAAIGLGLLVWLVLVWFNPKRSPSPPPSRGVVTSDADLARQLLRNNNPEAILVLRSALCKECPPPVASNATAAASSPPKNRRRTAPSAEVEAEAKPKQESVPIVTESATPGQEEKTVKPVQQEIFSERIISASVPCDGKPGSPCGEWGEVEQFEDDAPYEGATERR